MIRLLAGAALTVLLSCGEPGESPAGGAAEPPRSGTAALLIHGGTVVTMDARGAIHADGAVLIADGRIVEVGPTREVEARAAAEHPGAARIDATGRIVLPGLINAHTHAPMVLFRGLADDLPLMQWLREVIFPAEAEHVDEEMVRWGARLACLEMLRGGTTTFVDMYYFEDVIAEEAERCGMRAVLGQTLVDFPSPDSATFEEGVTRARRFVGRWRRHERIRPAIAPHATYTLSAEHLRAAHDLAVELDVPMLVHLAEDRAERALILERAEVTPVRYLHRLGALSERVLAAHVVVPEPEEIALLAGAGAGVAHCPQSNMKLAAGVAPVPELLEAGVAVGLGTDGAASNNDLDLWEEMDTAGKLHKVTRGDPTVVPADEALRMATSGGARALDLGDEIGSLEIGKRADLIVLRGDAPHHQPQELDRNLASRLVYSTKAADVETAIVGGRVVMRDREVLTVDEEEVRRRAAQIRERISSTSRRPRRRRSSRHRHRRRSSHRPSSPS